VFIHVCVKKCLRGHEGSHIKSFSDPGRGADRSKGDGVKAPSLIFDLNLISSRGDRTTSDRFRGNIFNFITLAPSAVAPRDHQATCQSNGRTRWVATGKVKRALGGKGNGRKVLLGSLVVFGIHGDDAIALKCAIRAPVGISIPEPGAGEAEDSKEVIQLEVL